MNPKMNPIQPIRAIQTQGSPAMRGGHPSTWGAPPMNMQMLEQKKAEFQAWYQAAEAQIQQQQQQQSFHQSQMYGHPGMAQQQWGPNPHQHQHQSMWGYGMPQQHPGMAHPSNYSPNPHHGREMPVRHVSRSPSPEPKASTKPTQAPVKKARKNAGKTTAKAKKVAVGRHPTTTGTGVMRPEDSYAQLAANAINAMPQRNATVKQIYDWVETNHLFYKQAGAPWWKNCIRHNLSMKKCFVRHPNAGGMGVHLWTLNHEAPLADLAPTRRRNATTIKAPKPVKVPKPAKVAATKSDKRTTKRDKNTSKLGIIRKIVPDADVDDMAGTVAVKPTTPQSAMSRHTESMMSLLAAASSNYRQEDSDVQVSSPLPNSPTTIGVR